ncbi:MAG: DNA translocase FtsK [Clostridia bacterium]|nr:DNA translocase FtsK [Clostridia bacterium]
MANQRKRKTTQKRNNKKSNNSFVMNKQLSAIIMFAVGILWFCMALIDAQGLWGGLRTFLFGVFGVFTFIFPLFLLVSAAFMALDKNDNNFTSKIIQISIIVTLISGIVHVFQCNPDDTYFIAIKEAYNVFYIDGSMLGGGAFGAIIGGIFLAITGGNVAAALIIEFVISFVLIMIFTGLTLGNLIRGISKPVKKVGEFTSEKINEYGEKAEQIAEERKKRKAEFNPDVDLGPDPDENAKPLTFDDEEIEEESNELVSFSDMKNNKQETEKVEQEKVINLDDIIKKSIKKEEPVVEEKVEDKTDEEIVEEIEESEKRVYLLPPIDCLNMPKESNASNLEAELKHTAKKLEETLSSFGVETRTVGICSGPSVTRYEIQPAAGVKISKITNLADDIALNLAASGVRIEAPIPNKAAVGIEVPNKNRRMVTMREVVDQPQYKNAKSKLNVALGKDITGEFVYSDLSKMPHLLIAGTTGSGKSVCLNSMIVSILYNATPEEVKLLMIDPKQVEFTVYNGIPHLLVPVVSDPRKASGALAWAVTEMLTRYKTFSENSVRDISGYNSICESQGKKKMPQIVIFIDELSDLMMAAPNEVEDSICRLAQMARAAGMHLVIATQRPSVDVITGIIKANIPSRISLSVSSQVDSRTIIDSVGAEKLLGNGDMLYYPVGIPKPIRVQGCFLSDKEVENVVTHIKNQAQSVYDDDVMKEIDKNAANTGAKKKDTSASDSDGGDGPADEMLPKAIEAVIEAQSASTTLLQRKLKLGYARAARIVDELEERGIIGPYEGAKPRKVLITKQQWYEMNALAQGGADKPYGEDEEDISEE